MVLRAAVTAARVLCAAGDIGQAWAAGQPSPGEMRYMADAALSPECRSGLRHPIAMEADYARKERAYLQAAGGPGAPRYVAFEGHIAPRPKMEGEGFEPAVVVERFLDVWPGRKCERDAAE